MSKITLYILGFSVVFFTLGLFCGRQEEISYALPPAFPCHATAENPCQDFYLYKTNYKEAFENTMAVLVYRGGGKIEYMESNFDNMLIECNISSFYEDTECAKDWLDDMGDLICEDKVCCGGNSIGWYTCF